MIMALIRVSADGLEVAWDERWQAEGTYAFDRGAERTLNHR